MKRKQQGLEECVTIPELEEEVCSGGSGGQRQSVTAIQSLLSVLPEEQQTYYRQKIGEVVHIGGLSYYYMDATTFHHLLCDSNAVRFPWLKGSK